MSGGSLMLANVRVCRARRAILQIDRLDVAAGTFAGVIGANGAGKTTLLRVSAGLVKPDRGVVELDGEDLTQRGGWRKCELRKQVGYIPQSAEYNAELPFTVREVVAMGRAGVRPLMTGISREDYRLVDHWIEVLGLMARRHQTFRSLSGGEQQKVLIARAMVQQPRILMLDEPCANLDFTWKYQISEIVEQLYHETGMTVLMVSHDTSVLPPACRRVILLAHGRLLGDGKVEEVLSPDRLRLAYQGRLETAVVGGRRHIVSTS
jgi:ABC-type Mn2+/Zn2+ transport system ATPase subunit